MTVDRRTPRPRRGARGACALLAVLAGACGPPRDAGGPPVRLVDRAADARVESAVPLDRSDEAAFEGAATLLDGPVGSVGAGRRFRHAGAWVGPVVLDRDPAGAELVVEAALVDLAPRRHVRVRARCAAARGPDERVFALELSFRPAPEELADPAWVEELFRQVGTFVRTPSPVAVDGDAVVLEAAFAPHVSTTQLLVGRTRAADAASSATFEVTQFGARGGWLYATTLPGRSPWVRAVTVRRDTRESLVLGTPGEARFELAVPRNRTRLTVAVAPLFARPDDELLVTLAAEGGGRRVSETVTLAGEGADWRDVELDVEPVAGPDTVVALSARPAGGGGTEALVAFGAPVVESVDPRQRPDVVVVSLDTMRADRSSAYGFDRETTPTLARLARESVVFENAITTAPWTLPAHASLWSGQHPDRHRAFGQHSRIAPDTPWVCEELRAAGYRTLAFTGGGYVSPEFGFARGFDRYGAVDPSYPPSDWVERRLAVGASGGPRDPRPPRSRAELLDLLREPRRAARFVFVHTYAAHNYAAGPDDLAAVGAARDAVDDLVLGLETNELNRRIAEAGPDVDVAALEERARLLYDASMRVADRLVADVLDALEASGRLDHTVLVVLSDHGEELFERGRIGHGGSVFEEMVRVPLLIRAPGFAPRRIDDVVSLVDVAPTLRELCDLRAAARGADDGRSLVPLLRGEALEPRPALTRGDRRDLVFRGLRGADWKLVREERPAAEERSRLFLLGPDPGERDDRAAARAAEVARREAELRDRVEALEALAPTGVDAHLSGEMLESLRALGYLGD